MIDVSEILILANPMTCGMYFLLSLVLSKNKFQNYGVCNGCHDITQKSVDVNDFDIVSVKGSDYRIHFQGMNEAINLFKNIILTRKKIYYKIKEINETFKHI